MQMSEEAESLAPKNTGLLRKTQLLGRCSSRKGRHSDKIKVDLIERPSIAADGCDWAQARVTPQHSDPSQSNQTVLSRTVLQLGCDT